VIDMTTEKKENKKVLCTIPPEYFEWANENDFSFSKLLRSAIRNHRLAISNDTFEEEES
tara:strand:+ start:199 stop:375 length:177 start_codon:yes stop_codon:yes gene_type:complete